MCGCSNQEVSNLCDVYEGETVDLSEIYSKNKDEATRLFNFYYNYGKHVESKDYKNYNCYTYDNINIFNPTSLIFLTRLIVSLLGR